MRRFFIRKSPRKRGHDYALPGAYFVTFITPLREPTLARFTRSRLVLSPLGQTVTRLWTDAPLRFPRVSVDTFVIMPDHVHALLILGGETTDRPVSLSEVVRWVKGCAARGTAVQQWSSVSRFGKPPFTTGGQCGAIGSRASLTPTI